MRILHLSDTHGKHQLIGDMPPADLIIHSGDLSFAGAPNEVLDFIEWFGGLNYKYKIFIAGNHDYCLDRKKPERIQHFLPRGCFYLYHSGITIEGIKFWGVPFLISDETKGSFDDVVEKIPADTDVLISHRPPYAILDWSNHTTYGCMSLLQAVMKIAPRYHLFGHIHDAYGIQKSNATTFANASLLDEKYQLKNEPFIFEI